MEQNINLCISLVLVLLEIILYLFLLSSVIPKILKTYCIVSSGTDRGLKKFVYPDGRGILYEPHPSIRKYVNEYVLYTVGECKYLKCKLDAAISRIKYTVVMFDRRNNVIDLLSADEISPMKAKTTDMLLHRDTSYVSLVVESVNGTVLNSKNTVCCKLWRLAVYSLAVALLTFAELVFIKSVLGIYDASWMKSGFLQGVSAAAFIRPSLIAGITVGLLTFVYRRLKRVRWIR